MPAATMTYTSLVSDIKAYCERPDDAQLAAQIPRILMLAESELAADLKVLGNELVVAATLSIGDSTLIKPSYWRKTTSFSITVPGAGRQELFKRTYEYVRNYWPDQTLTGVPRFYAEYNYNNFLIAPTPDAAYPLELIYFVRLDPLSNDNQTNWSTANAPQVLFYNCMYQAQMFLKNFDKAAVWKDKYAEAVASLKLEDAERVVDRTVVES
jgi:hypothetical protein